MFDALSKAGITEYSVEKHQSYKEDTISNGGGQKDKFKFVKVFIENDSSQNITLRNGDNILISRNETPLNQIRR